MGNQGVKAIVGVVLLIAGLALIVWQVKRQSNDPDKNSFLSESQQKGQEALQSLFGQVNGKWDNNALWADQKTKKEYVPVAKEVFGDSPTMDGITIIDANPDSEDLSQINLVLQVGSIEQCVIINLRPGKDNKYAVVEVRKDSMTVKDYKSNYL